MVIETNISLCGAGNLNEYYDCKDSIRELLKANVEQAIADINMNKTKVIQHRLREIDEARNDYISLIAAGTIDESSLDEQFQMLYDEEQEMNAKLKSLQEQNNIDLAQRSRISKAIQEIDSNSCELTEYSDLLVRKLIECVKVLVRQRYRSYSKVG